MPALHLRSAAALPAHLPHVWQGQEMACAEEAVISTGHPTLDAELPGGGWPMGLVEVIHDRPEQQVWQLTGPALARELQARAGPVVLVAAPFEPFVPGLQARGVPGDRLLWIRADKPAERLWATEQALRCAEVTAVLAWLPQAKSSELRRLQIGAQQHKHLLFVFRPSRSLVDASPARVRLQLGGSQGMEIRILKRRGPPLEHPLLLAASPARLAALLESRKRRPASMSNFKPPVAGPETVAGRSLHVLDCIAAVG